MEEPSKSSREDRPTVLLSDADGNVFNVIGLARRAILRHSGRDAAEQFTTKASALHSYDDVIRLVMETCEVEWITRT